MAISLIRKAIVAAMLTCCAPTNLLATNPCIPVDKNIEAKVEAKLKKMTLDEKIGQMCELSAEAVTDFDEIDKTGKFTYSKTKLDDAIGKYKVGSILNVPMSRAQKPEVYYDFIKAIQDISMKNMGIPDIYGIDNNHGTTYVDGGTLFPQPLAQAASFNREIARRACEICAYETRAASLPWIYTPTMDLARNAAWPRVWESYGEDAYINAEMASQAVLGFQGTDPNKIDKFHVAACLKHYMGYGSPVSGQDRTPSSITDRDMREKHFAPFLACARAGALSVMVNSAVNNGIPFHANKELITGWLKEGLNWDGMVVTDWADIDNLWKRDHIAANKKEAIMIAINAGIDMSMDPYSTDFCVLLKELVSEGKVSMDRIDDAVRRVLRLKYRLNLFDEPYHKVKDFPKFGCKEHADFATRAAEECQVLLKNDGILPLAAGKKILVTGPNANQMRCLNGGWSYSWQGHIADEYAGAYNTIYEALSNKYGTDNVTLEQGVTYVDDGSWAAGAWKRENADRIDAAVAAAKNADVIVACIGENSYCETPGNISDLTLSANQRNLVKALAATGKPIVLVLNEGRARIIKDIEPLANAVVDVILPGNYGANALANLLAGDANFSAKLPFTYPSNTNSLSTYDYKPCENVTTMEGEYNYDAKLDVQWPFGHGLSYTTYSYDNLRADRTNFTADDTITLSIDVTNTGKVDGKEPVLLFTSDVVASITPDNSRLRNFTKVDLKAGETKTVTLTLRGSDMAFVGMANKWTLEEGDFRVKVGDKAIMLHCTDTKVWDTPNKD